LNFLLGLSLLEVFVKCYKLRATKCTFVEHSSGIISPYWGDNSRRKFNKGTFCRPEFVTLYKELQGR
jgi:hypothetical protein